MRPFAPPTPPPAPADRLPLDPPSDGGEGARADALAWVALRDAWDVRAGSESEHALARAVLADAHERAPALVRAASALLAAGCDPRS